MRACAEDVVENWDDLEVAMDGMRKAGGRPDERCSAGANALVSKPRDVQCIVVSDTRMKRNLVVCC